MRSYIDEQYCSLNVECPSRCCLHGECQTEYDACYQRYDLPLLYGAAAGFALAIFMLALAWLFTPRLKIKVFAPPEEVFVDDGGPIYYEAEEKIPEEVPEEPFVDDIAGPLYYEAGIDQPTEEVQNIIQP